MSLPVNDITALTTADPTDDEAVPLGDALAELAVAVPTDAVADVRDERTEL